MLDKDAEDFDPLDNEDPSSEGPQRPDVDAGSSCDKDPDQPPGASGDVLPEPSHPLSTEQELEDHEAAAPALVLSDLGIEADKDGPPSGVAGMSSGGAEGPPNPMEASDVPEGAGMIDLTLTSTSTSPLSLSLSS